MPQIDVFDSDGIKRTVEDFETITTEGLIEKKKLIEPNEMYRPDILADKIYGDSRATNLLILNNNKCLFDFDEGEEINFFEV